MYMRSTKAFLALCVGCCLCPSALQAGVIVASSLSLTQLQILPSSGTVQFLPPINASAFVQVFDSLGGFDQQFDSVDDGATNVSAATALASAAAAASAVSMTASSSSGINIPQIEAAAGTVPGSPFGMLQGFFQIVGTTGPVSVQFLASLSTSQSLSTTGYGQSANSEVTFNLLLPDISEAPILFFDNLLQIGANDSQNTSSSFTLSSTVMLMPDMPLSLIAATDAETPPGISQVAEPSSGLLVFCVMASFASMARLKQRRRHLRCE
jgi:hypothetical protein